MPDQGRCRLHQARHGWRCHESFHRPDFRIHAGGNRCDGRGSASLFGCKVVTHARGAEAVRYAAKAGADVILHASWMDDEGLEWVVRNGCHLCPTLSLVVNDIDFTQATDGCYPDFPDAHKRELESACKVLPKAKAAGVPFMVGSDAGFAVTPYGEWHARELEHFVTSASRPRKRCCAPLM